MTDSTERVASLLKEAQSLRDNSRLEEAEILLRQAVEYAPEHAKAHLVLGSTLIALGRPLEAASILERSTSLPWEEKGIDAFSTFAIVHLALAEAFYALERYDDAVDALNDVGRAIERHPSGLVQDVWMNPLFTRHAAAILSKPAMNRRDGDLDCVIELTRRVCSSDPRPTAHLLEPRVLLAQALTEKGDRLGAVAALVEALYVAQRFRGLDEGKAIPRIHWRLSELILETGAEGPILRRLFARLLSLYHALAARLEHRRLLREVDATDEPRE